MLIEVHGRPTRRSDWRVKAPTRTVDVEAAPTVYPWRMWPSAYFGVYPEVMEDKWFAYMEHRRLRVYRSWTGCAIWELSFGLEPVRLEARRLRIVDDTSVYERGSDRDEALMADWLVWAHFGTLPEDVDRAQWVWDDAWRVRKDA